MEFRFIPAVLPFAPRPLPEEVLSSWLQRVADANRLSFGELLESVRDARLPVLTTVLDYRLPAAWRRRLAAFCRVPEGWVRAIDLASQHPGQDLFWFTHTLVFLNGPGEPRRQLCRPFCTDCGEQQREHRIPTHVPAPWAWAFQTHCPLHETALIERCRGCGAGAMPHWHRRGFCCRVCDTPWTASHTLPDSPTLRSVLSLQQSILACLHGQAPESQWFGAIEARAGVQMARSLTHLLLQTAAPGLVLADLLVPEEFRQRYNIGGRFAQPQMARLPWFARFLVLAALHQLALAFSPNGGDWSASLRSVRRTCSLFFQRRSAEELLTLAAGTRHWPTYLSTVFHEATRRVDTPRLPLLRRPPVTYSKWALSQVWCIGTVYGPRCGSVAGLVQRNGVSGPRCSARVLAAPLRPVSSRWLGAYRDPREESHRA